MCMLLCFIDPRVKRIRNETSNCPGIFWSWARGKRRGYCPGASRAPQGSDQSFPQILAAFSLEFPQILAAFPPSKTEPVQ